VKRLAIPSIVLLAVLAAACSSEASSPRPTPEPTPSEAAASDGAFPSLQAGPGGLADVLPTEVGGIEITYQSTSGEQVLGGGQMGPEGEAFFNAIGAEASDLTSAFGAGTSADQSQLVTIFAFRVAGVDESTLREEFLTAMGTQGQFIGEETEVGGRTVHSLAAGSATGGTGFLYVKDDVIYVINAQPPELAEEALAALP
jgi:hypothetical protein